MINTINNIDSRNILSILKNEELVQTTITSPPYYDMKDYDVDNQIGFGQSYEAYLNDLQSVFKQVLQRTSEDGTLWIIIDTFKRENSIVPLPFDLANKLREVGWHFQDIIIWKKDKTVPWSSGGFIQKKIEYILFFSKNAKFKHNKDIIRVYDTQQLKQWWVKYPERYNPKGKTLDQVWEYPIPVQGSWGREYVRHFCPLPKEMVATMLLLSTNEGDVVLDPFAGSGAELAQAAYMKRQYIGAELNPNYISQADEYIKSTIKDGVREYEDSKTRLNQDQFENTIWELRALKYGRLLIKNIKKETNDDVRIIVTPREMCDRKLQVEYTIIADDRRADVYIEVVSRCAAIPPLSKFEIVPMVNFSETNVDLNDYYSYSATNTSKYLLEKDKSKARVYSKIKLNIEEQTYGN